jgi:Ni,Fe-hydrogenase III small subunit
VGLFKRILKKGRFAQAAPPLPESELEATTFRGSFQVRHVDTGSCNGCELELSGCFGPVYDAERYGVRLTPSPRHADGLLVTGVVTRNMEKPLLDAHQAMAQPFVVVAVGDCACNGGFLKDGYGVIGPVSEVITPDAYVLGCPPKPEEIITVLRRFSGR